MWLNAAAAGAGTAPSAAPGVACGQPKGEVSQSRGPRRPRQAPRGPGLVAAAAMAGGLDPGTPDAPSAQHFLYEVPPWVMCRFYKVMDALEPADWCQFGGWQPGRATGRTGGRGRVSHGRARPKGPPPRSLPDRARPDGAAPLRALGPAHSQCPVALD